MKRSWIVIAALSLVLLVLFGLSTQRRQDKLAAFSAPKTPKEHPYMREFIRLIEGVWADEASLLVQAEDPEFLVEIRSARISGSEIRLIVSEYCRPDLAEYLHFKLDGKTLVYQGASAAGCFIRLDFIESIRITPVVEQGDTLLMYEAREAEGERVVRERLRRVPEQTPRPEVFRIGLENHLRQLLEPGRYQLCDAFGKAAAAEAVFGSADPKQTLHYMGDLPFSLPMYKEMRVRPETDVIVLGDLQGPQTPRTYALEWDRKAIYLYSTEIGTPGPDGALPLMKHQFLYTLAPVSGAPD
ncbi:MAG: hypothetical protein NW241_03605 [Bacteroidia bacterium]|nr:hypothetical protein [Bacteroidia bacterium]